MNKQDEWTQSEVRDHYVGNVCDCVNHADGCEAENRFDRMLAQVRREAAAEQREKDARIAETRYFGGGSTGSANRWGAKQAAAAIREQGAE